MTSSTEWQRWCDEDEGEDLWVAKSTEECWEPHGETIYKIRVGIGVVSSTSLSEYRDKIPCTRNSVSRGCRW